MKCCSWQITWPGLQGCCSVRVQCPLWIPKLSALMKGVWTCLWPYAAQANVSILWSEEIECSLRGFPGDLAVEYLPSNSGDTGSIPGSGRAPGGGKGNPLQYSRLENPTDRGAWRATVQGVRESQTRLSNECITANTPFTPDGNDTFMGQHDTAGSSGRAGCWRQWLRGKHRRTVCVFRGHTNPRTPPPWLLFQNTVFLFQLQHSVWTQHLMRAVRCRLQNTFSQSWQGSHAASWLDSATQVARFVK